MSDTISWSEIFSVLKNKTDLTSQQSTWAMNTIMSGAAKDTEIKEFLLSLKDKGESASEITSFVEVLLQHGVKLEVTNHAVDTCGTGGDSLSTVNISTAAALVVAGCGIPVVKHGNRAASSKSGSADVLETLGVLTSMSPSQVKECFEVCKITFYFAPTFHPAMKHVGPVRKELGVPTVFNILGPLANPAQPKAQVVGVANLKMAPIIAQVLANRKTSAFVVRGKEGLDEISTCGPTQIWDVRSGVVKEFEFDAQELGINKVQITDLKGGDATFNAQLIRKALGANGQGPIQDAICVNAAASIVAFENLGGDFFTQMQLAYARAKGSVESGASLDVLNRWANFSENVRAHT
ncbi:MAG: anthranilate phosphoribosyltransferase [Candidatus Nanopelagicales bacterium]|nr:anthranilate phosphoribosyltransferase [Candidatus Nanopelagicales bacterium]